MAVSPSLVGNVGEAVSSSISNTSLVRTYSACLRSLFSHHGVKLGTERLLQVSSKLGQPHENFDILHVAGTNGKGTTCAKLAACLSMKGYKVGTYTSPHILCLRERIRVDNQMISEEALVSLYNRVIQAAEELSVSLSFFEILTQIAFSYFSEEEVDWAVIETGLGGRLDATNIIPSPRCTIITSIGWDHMNVLGNTLDLIAQEKAGVIKQKVPVVLGPSASCYRCFWKKADSLGCEVWEVKPEPRGEDFDDENQRICRSVIENVLRIDLLPDQLESALAVQLPLRAQVLTKYELQIASQRCLPPRLANAAKADSPTIHLPDTSPAKGHAGENSHKTSLSQNGVANPSSSSSPPVGAGMVGEMMALNTPHGVIVDVGHNETAVERLLQFVGHHYFGMPVRLVLSLSTGRSLSMLQPVINYLSFPRNNRLLRLHFVEADHERGLSAVSVLQELQTSDSITAALRTELLAGLEEQHGAVLKMRQERKTFSQGEGDLTGKIASKTVEGMRIDAVSTLSNRRKKDLHTPEEIEDISEPYRHLLDTCQAGNLPDVLRFAYRQATAEGSLLVVGGTFFMMREVVDTLGFLRGAVDEIDMNETSVASARSLPPYSSSS